MKKIVIDEMRCKGCSLCVQTCPKKVIVIDNEKLNAKGYNPAVTNDELKNASAAPCVQKYAPIV